MQTQTARVSVSMGGNDMLCSIHGDIDHHNARMIRMQIDDELYKQRPRKLTLDLSRVEFMDSSGLGLILGRVERASSLRTSVRVTGLSPTLMKLVRLAGIERVKNLTVTK